MLLLELFWLITFAGMPPTVHPFSLITSDTTTAFAAIATFDEILTSPIIFAPVPMNTLSPIIAAFEEPLVAPIVTPSCIRQFLPIRLPAETTIVP